MPQHTGYGRCNVQNEKEVFDAVCADPSTSNCQVTCEKGISLEYNLEYTA
jgi:hypothetical protein